MNVLHRVDYYSLQYLHVLKTTDYAHRAALDQYVTLCQQLQSFQCIPVRTNKTLSSLDKSFLIANERSNFNYFTENSILHHSERLLIWNTSTDQFNNISCLDDGVGIPSLFGGSDDHRALE